MSGVVLWIGNSKLNGAFSHDMQNAQMYRQYAEDCMQLAQQAPQHRDALLKIAQAWTTLAKEADQKDSKGQGDGKPKD